MMDRNHYRSMSTTSLEARLQRANDRVKRAASLPDALSDLFAIDEIEAALKERRANAANTQILQALAC